MKKMILLILPVLLFTGCAVKEKEAEVTVFGNTVPAVYSGRVKKKLPNGEGTAILENDARAEGTFELGTYIAGKTDSVPYTITYMDQEISGTYTGEVSEQLPSGNGTFTADTLSYTGTWSAGAPAGTGTITASSFRIDTPAEVLEGSYTGDVQDTRAEGNGVFIYQSGNEEIQLEGGFTDNRFDGPMTKTVRYKDTVKTYPVYYRNGRLQETAVALIAYLEGMRNDSYCLNVEQLTFISDHSRQFEGKVKEEELASKLEGIDKLSPEEQKQAYEALDKTYINITHDLNYVQKYGEDKVILRRGMKELPQDVKKEMADGNWIKAGELYEAHVQELPNTFKAKNIGSSVEESISNVFGAESKVKPHTYDLANEGVEILSLRNYGGYYDVIATKEGIVYEGEGKTSLNRAISNDDKFQDKAIST
ncbi:MAG: hypothetical protein IJJ29_08120, partial [Solobacterium sp.]|nr:hypothetical protein [Solobacterium sp.]